MYIRLFHRLFVSVIGLIWLVGCTSTPEGMPANQAEARKLLLTHLIDNIIIPHTDRLYDRLEVLGIAIDSLAHRPDTATLDRARMAWLQAYTQWLYVNTFNFGPGEKPIIGMMMENLGTWPVNVAEVERRIEQQNLELSDFSRDTRGLLTIEYILFGENALQKLKQPDQGAKRLAYLKAVYSHAHSWVVDAKNGWPEYRATMLNDLGNAHGSPFAVYYNEFVKTFEQIKNFKIGLPAGKRVGQARPEPHLVEAYYSGSSVAMLKAHFDAVERLWRGVDAQGADGYGFEDMLNQVTGGEALKTQTQQQIAAVRAMHQKLPDDARLDELIVQNPALIAELYESYQRLTRYFKSDLSSVLGVMITFSSGDGD